MLNGKVNICAPIPGPAVDARLAMTADAKAGAGNRRFGSE
jgi:hypothetical protein